MPDPSTPDIVTAPGNEAPEGVIATPHWSGRLGLRFANMTIGRKLVALVILCVGCGFLVMIAVQVTGVRADLHRMAYLYNLQVTSVMANSLADEVRRKQPVAVEQLYQAFLEADHGEFASIVALDTDGQVLAAHDTGILDGVDLHREIFEAQETLAFNDTYSSRGPDHVAFIVPILHGPDRDRVGTLAIAWSLADLNAVIRANLNRQGVIAGFAILTLVVILLALLSFTVSLPLRAVSRATIQIAQCEENVPVPETRRGDEIGEMARALEVFKHHIAMLDEMTERQEEHSRQLSEALENERKYNALHREFVSMASHEFRTPLAIIDGAAQRLIRRSQRMTAEEVVERGGKIRNAVSRMIGLVDSTLNASRMEAGQIAPDPEPCSLHNILEAVCTRQQEIAPDHQIKLALQDAPDLIVADPKQLDQIFTNLLSNAVKYSPQKGSIEVSAIREGALAVIGVSDHGVGIPEDELPKLFERFFRASTSTGIPGTGIGLNLVRELVRMHGGSLGVESTESVGSTFIIRLPLDTQVSDAQSRQSENGATVDAGLRSAVGN